MSTYDLERTSVRFWAQEPSQNMIKVPTTGQYNHIFQKENSVVGSRADLLQTPVKARERHLHLESTPYSLLKSANGDSACFQTRSRRVHDSALPQEHWKSFNSNIKQPRDGKTPFEEFFEFSNRKPLQTADSESEQLYHLSFSDSPLKKRASLDFSDIKQPIRGEKLIFDSIIANCERRLFDKPESGIKKSQDRTGGCNCKKSKCLQMYCECFKQGGFCGPSCYCSNCENKNDTEHRRRKLNSLQKKNPNVFTKVIAVKRNGEQQKVHSRGCNCRKSGCLKKYCECHQFGAVCTDQCKCKGCKNTKEEEKPGADYRRRKKATVTLN